MNIHMNDKIAYYLPVIYQMENITFFEKKKDFIEEVKKKTKEQLIKIWNKSLEESFQLHLVLALALLYALQRDESGCEDNLRLAQQKAGIPRVGDIIRCILYCEMAKFDDALRIIKNLPMEVSKMTFILRIKADICFAMKEYQAAEGLYLKIINEMPNKSTICSRLGEINMLNNRLSKAEELFLKAIELDSMNIMAHFYLGDIYKLNGEISKAKMEYGISAAIDLDNNLSQMARQKLFLLCAEKN